MKNKELPFIKEMFDHIAPKYDLLNRLLSVRQDIYWRSEMVKRIQEEEKMKTLDVACGTGDVMIELLNQSQGNSEVVGIDFSPRMLTLAKHKIAMDNLNSKTDLVQANGLILPFKDNTFDAVTIAFGIRNIQDRLSALRSFYRTLKPGGMVLVLELTLPQRGFLHNAYLLYFKKLLPIIGKLFSNNPHAYRYLPDSVMHFPGRNEFAGIMRKAGFEKVSWKKMTFGIATLFRGYKL